MGKKSQVNPKPQDGGSPAPTPLPPTAKSGGATHNRTVPDDVPPPAQRDGFVKTLFRNFRPLAMYLLLFLVSRNIFLCFDLDYVSVSIHNNNNNDDPRANVTAVWDIAFSTRPYVNHLNVSVRFMSRDFKLETVGDAASSSRNATLTVLLPPDFVFPKSGGLMLEEVMIEGNLFPRYGVKAACKNVTVSSQGMIMEGGPRSCPIVHYGRIF